MNNIYDWIKNNPLLFILIITIFMFIVLLITISFIIFLFINFKRKKECKTHNHDGVHSETSDNKEFYELTDTNKINNDLKNSNFKSDLLKNNSINNCYLESFYEENKKTQDVNHLYEELLELKNKYSISLNKINEILDEQNKVLSKISNLSIEEAKKLLMVNIYKQSKSELAEIYNFEKNKINSELESYAQNHLISAMELIAEKMIAQRSLSTIPIQDENLKGKIIGKHGRNKHLFEKLTGTDIIVEKTSEITISSANPIRREIAVNLFNLMLQSKVIEPSKLENLYQVVKEDFQNKLIADGKKALEEDLQIFDINPDIYPYVGRLKYRTSYGQNVLDHCIESAKYAEIIAKQIGINFEKAKRAAFFHDIGKSIDFNENYDHVESGLAIAKKYYLPDYICNAIESHHNKVEPDNMYSALVKVVDTLSAARPGARSDSLNEFIKRVTKLEELCKSIDGVQEAFAVQSGRILRIIVKPDVILDEQLNLLHHEIKKIIETDEITNKHQIKIILIREKRFEFLVNRKVDNLLNSNSFLS
ncbi:HDIG domain-containing metalloprotein [Mycoplasmoides alvi]|uniref:HDIG domain-containing metalloprotein n=1 Tax=Mycoplasmoides alvi TaxID=78580 RepID=UPI000696B668|nr:HDIG domain-containing metalloprotein [Mycoplasmoides alvi]